MAELRSLHDLLEKRAWDEIRSLLQDQDREVCLSMAGFPYRGRTPLHVAILCAAPADIVLSILELKPDGVRDTNNFGDTPLHYATFCSSSYAVIEALLERDANCLDSKNRQGQTPRDYDLSKLDKASRELVTRPTTYVLTEQLSRSRKEEARLREELACLSSHKTRGSGNAAEIAAFQRENAELKEDISFRKRELEEVTQSSQRMAEEISSLKKKISTLNQALSTKEMAMEELRAAAIASAKKQATLLAQVRKLEAILHQHRQSTTQNTTKSHVDKNGKGDLKQAAVMSDEDGRGSAGQDVAESNTDSTQLVLDQDPGSKVPSPVLEKDGHHESDTNDSQTGVATAQCEQAGQGEQQNVVVVDATVAGPFDQSDHPELTILREQLAERGRMIAQLVQNSTVANSRSQQVEAEMSKRVHELDKKVSVSNAVCAVLKEHAKEREAEMSSMRTSYEAKLAQRDQSERRSLERIIELERKAASSESECSLLRSQVAEKKMHLDRLSKVLERQVSASFNANSAADKNSARKRSREELPAGSKSQPQLPPLPHPNQQQVLTQQGPPQHMGMMQFPHKQQRPQQPPHMQPPHMQHMQQHMQHPHMPQHNMPHHRVGGPVGAPMQMGPRPPAGPFQGPQPMPQPVKKPFGPPPKPQNQQKAEPAAASPVQSSAGMAAAASSESSDLVCIDIDSLAGKEKTPKKSDEND